MNELDLSSPEGLLKAYETLEQGGQLEGQNTPNTDAQPGTTQAGGDQPAPDAKGADDKGNLPEAEPKADEPKPVGISTRDGKHVIPFSVLESARDKATRAEELLAQANAQIEALKAQGNKASEGAKDGEGARTDGQPNADDLSPEDLERLKEDFPTVHKALMAAQRAQAAIEQKLAPVVETVQTQAQREAQALKEEVQSAIESVPKMAHIQATDPEAFKLAREFDTMLLSQAAWKGKAMAERFEKVVEMVEQATGKPIDVPGAKQLTKTPQELAAAARQVADAQAKKTAGHVPTSLSEFPAGQPAATSEAQAIEAMTSTQLAAKLSKMTPEEMDAYFQTL